MKLSAQREPTIRKRTIKIVATKYGYELHYMGTMLPCRTIGELFKTLPEELETIARWAGKL